MIYAGVPIFVDGRRQCLSETMHDFKSRPIQAMRLLRNVPRWRSDLRCRVIGRVSCVAISGSLHVSATTRTSITIQWQWSNVTIGQLVI